MSDLDSIGVTFEGDSSSLQNAAKQAADAVEQLGEASSSAMNADTTAPDALATALEDFASRCKNAFADAANMDLSWIADGLGSLSEKSGTVEGLTATLGDFRASLDELVETKREVKDGFTELRREFDDLLMSYKTGNLTIDDTKAKFDELKECFGANVTVLEELQYGNEALYSEVRETASAIEQLDQSSRESAQTQEQVAQALDKAAKAAAQAAQEAAKQAKAEDVTATRMRNAGKNANELREEIIKLGKAKREALSAGETKEADALNTELIETRKQLQELTREANVAKTAILGKAQAGMQAASTLGNLAKSAKDGTLSMADLATGIMSVTMAIKAGLGPIGWIMMALQGLQMAWDYFSESEKKATEATQEAKKAMDELNASLLDHAKAVASADISRQMADNKKAMGEMSDAYAEEYRQLDRTIAKQKEKSAAAIEVAKKQRDTQIELAKRRHEQGKFDKDSMQMFIESAEQTYQTVVNNQTAAIEVLQRQRLQAEEANDKIILRKREEFLEGLQHDYGEALTAEWDEMTEYQVQNIVQRSAEIQHDLDVANKRVEVLQAQIAAEKDKDKKKELEEQLEEVQKLVNYKANELTSLADQADRICKDFKDGAKQVSENFNLTGIDLPSSRWLSTRRPRPPARKYRPPPVAAGKKLTGE